MIKTYEVKIYCGLREGYSSTIHSIAEVEQICQKFVDKKRLCVTVTPTKFIYRKGSEPGAIIGLIQYPRFLRMECKIKALAIGLTQILIDELKQERMSIVFPDETLMLEKQLVDQFDGFHE